MTGAAGEVRATQQPGQTGKHHAMSAKLPHRHFGLALSFILSIIMSGIISAVMTLVNQGLSADFVTSWPPSWAFSWLVAFPSLQIALPVARRLAGTVVAPPQAENPR